MKAMSLLQKIEQRIRRGHHHSGQVKWGRRGERLTNKEYQVAEWEARTNQLNQEKTALERLTN